MTDFKDDKTGEDLRRVLEALPFRLRQRIVHDVAVISERSYWRGYQQGWFMAVGGEGPVFRKITAWRFFQRNWCCKELPATPGDGLPGKCGLNTLARVTVEHCPRWFRDLAWDFEK
jgi:hypothetical protein